MVGFTAVMVVVNSSVRAGEIGAVNGFGQSLAAAARALGPVVGGSLWSAAVAAHFAAGGDDGGGDDAEDGGGNDNGGDGCPRAFALLPDVARSFVLVACLVITLQLPAWLETGHGPEKAAVADGGDGGGGDVELLVVRRDGADDCTTTAVASDGDARHVPLAQPGLGTIRRPQAP